MYVVTDKVEVKKIVNCCLVSWYCTAKWVVTTMFDIHTLFLFANSYIEIKKDCILLFGILRHGCLVWVFALFVLFPSFFFSLFFSLSLFSFLTISTSGDCMIWVNGWLLHIFASRYTNRWTTDRSHFCILLFVIGAAGFCMHRNIIKLQHVCMHSYIE